MKTEKRAEIDKKKILALSKELGCDKIIAELLIAKNIDNAVDYNSFVSPELSKLTDPFLYTDMAQVVERINIAINSGETIIIYGDYDCDGICAVSILWKFLLDKGAKADYYVPNRHVDGYGLSLPVIEKIAEEKFPDLLITVDCGITAVEEVAHIREGLGIDVIVTDHHECGDTLPDCLIINPKREKSSVFREYCGAGVVFQLISAVGGRDCAYQYLDTVALATVGDIVPLYGDNRILTYWGLKKLNSPKAVQGLKQMLTALNITGKASEYDLTYKIVPRINSFGRLGDASRAVTLFTSSDYFILECLIKEFDDENKIRQQRCLDIEISALEMLSETNIEDLNAIILYNKLWDSGIIGITAAKLVEKFHKPTILFTIEDNICKGSARSVEGINIYESLSAFKSQFNKFGGHAQAAGVSIDVDKINDFALAFNMHIGQFNANKTTGERTVFYDVELNEGEINIELAEEVEKLAPFGCGNEKPSFLINCRRMNFAPISKNLTPHIKAVRKGYSLIGFNMADKLGELNSNYSKNLIVSLNLNYYNEKKYIQANISDYAVADKNDEEYTLAELFANYNNLKNAVLNDEQKNRLLALSVEREVFADYYRKINKAISENANTCNIFAISIIKNVEIENTLQLYFCFYVFVEAGIFAKSKEKGIVSCKTKADLNSSLLYNYIMKLKGKAKSNG